MPRARRRLGGQQRIDAMKAAAAAAAEKAKEPVKRKPGRPRKQP